MTRRLRSVRRVLDVQKDMQRLEEQRLRELQQREAELEAAQETLIATLGGNAHGSGRFGEILAGQVGRLAGQQHGVAASRARQTEVVLQHASRLRHVENVERDLSAEHGRHEERTQQSELGDLIAGHGSARLR